MYRFKVAGASLVMLVSLFFGASSPATAGETGWGLVGTASADLGTPPTPSKADTAAQGKSGVKGYPGKSVGSTTKASKACLGPVSYKYAAAQQAPAIAPSDSVSAAMNVGNPWLSTCDWHTLTEISVSNASSTNIVEFGWTKDPTTFGDMKPRLFASMWVGGVFKGYNTGWVNYASRVNTLGDDLTVDVGTEPLFAISQTATAYWVAYKSQWVAYALKTNFSGATPAQTPPSFDRIQLFGEVALGGSGCTDMGAAPAPLATATVGPRIVSTTYAGTPTPTAVNLSMYATNPTEYNAALISGSVRSLHYGGPGPC